MRILVLGCGPAGLMAAHAAAELGHDVRIVSRKRKSEMFGAQYLHQPIGGIDCGYPAIIDYELRGTSEGYRDKVYGNGYTGTVSPDELEQKHTGFNIRKAYDDLWDTYGHYVIDAMLTPDSIHGFFDVQKDAELIISSIPAPLLCKDPGGHRFASQEIYAIGDAPERGVFNPIKVAENTVVCNGEPDVGWYRTANVFGRSTTEWPLKRKPPVEGVARVTKPLSNECICYPDVRRVGRYGKWQKGILSHSAYYEVHDLLVGQGIQEGLF